VLDLGELIAKNKGLIPKASGSNIEATPVINGYKMLKDSPSRDDVTSQLSSLTSSRGSGFKLPSTPTREELGHRIANQAMIRKREHKANQKFEKLKKLGIVSE
jgi:hypothetical protein